MNEAASHAEREYRLSRGLEDDARSLMGKKPDAIQAFLVIDAEHHVEEQDNLAATHVAWVHTYALARACTILSWALARVNSLEFELAGQHTLFACTPDEADQ